ncbi:MAG TPA: hypothetical protein QF606_05205 [Anaerolineales bacterium]|nr:hypothetical protein [Anaerolineales bacterium]|tara:strand:- start:1828 stop:1989 length:162 start_codon:yes stop_codon:yes gene_type:complete
MNLREKLPVLIRVDIQMGFLEEEYWGGGRNNRDAEIICSTIIEKWVGDLDDPI